MPDFVSETKVGLDSAVVAGLVRRSFDRTVISSRIAQGGMYNAGYHLVLDGPPVSVFLKVAPPAGIAHLSYEQNMMAAEAQVLRLLEDAALVQTPRLLACDLSRRVLDRDYLFMTHLDGEPLPDAGVPATALPELRREIGRIAAASAEITGPCFGYPGNPDLQAESWPRAFARMWDALMSDAERFGAPWPMPRLDIDVAFASAANMLVEIDRPRLVHFDWWDGNVLVENVTSKWRVSGILDWERAFFGDPLAELVSLSLYTDTDQYHALLEGLGRTTETPSEKRRLALYRAYLWLIMIVEAGPRGFAGSIRTSGSRAASRFRRDLAVAAGRL
jgi:aminoglycoside phosphotransferase (APT) family kinase protein